MANFMNPQKRNILRITVVTLLSLVTSSCCIAPLRVANPLEVTVIDAESGSPIPDAQVIYIVSDLHDYLCKGGRVVRTTSDTSGNVDISGKRKWGFYIAAPGGLPVPDHLIAIWASGYSTYLFSQYSNIAERKKRCENRSDILQALSEIPHEQQILDPWLNLKSNLIGGIIKLPRIKQ
jgi:hypothetical protein